MGIHARLYYRLHVAHAAGDPLTDLYVQRRVYKEQPDSHDRRHGFQQEFPTLKRNKYHDASPNLGYFSHPNAHVRRRDMIVVTKLFAIYTWCSCCWATRPSLLASLRALSLAVPKPATPSSWLAPSQGFLESPRMLPDKK